MMKICFLNNEQEMSASKVAWVYLNKSVNNCHFFSLIKEVFKGAMLQVRSEFRSYLGTHLGSCQASMMELS